MSSDLPLTFTLANTTSQRGKLVLAHFAFFHPFSCNIRFRTIQKYSLLFPYETASTIFGRARRPRLAQKCICCTMYSCWLQFLEQQACCTAKLRLESNFNGFVVVVCRGIIVLKLELDWRKLPEIQYELRSWVKIHEREDSGGVHLSLSYLNYLLVKKCSWFQNFHL